MTDLLKLPVSSLKLQISQTDYSILSDNKNTRATNILGQERAQSALGFGVAMQNPGYNIYVMGEPGTGRLSMITNHLTPISHSQETPPSYAYVENFENNREPVAIELPAGQAQVFCKDINRLIDNLIATFPEAFESPSYLQKKTAIERTFNQLYNSAIDIIEQRSKEKNIALFRDTESITFAPIRDNKVLDEEQFNQLSQEERDTFHKDTEALEDSLGDELIELPQWRRALVEKNRQLDNVTIRMAISPLFKELTDRYQNIDNVITYLSEIKKDLGETIKDLFVQTQSLKGISDSTKKQLLKDQYQPNILINYKENTGSPVIYEPNPTYQNLFGRIEYSSDQGALTTNYQRICPGSLHRANGGYLILDADKLLNSPFVWEGLKRALKSGRIEIEEPYSELGINTVTLKPEVIPLNIKVILVGSTEIYYLLQDLDDEFNEMFRILADFDYDIPRNADNMQAFAQLMEQQAHDSGAKPLAESAVISLMEHSCRLAEHQQRLSAHINDALEIIGEANFLCKSTEIDSSDIEQALSAREYRNGRIAQSILEEMLDGTILINTSDSVIGQINGLTVLEVGGSSFGAPSRITVTVYPGSRGIVDIEREAELGLSIHSKGVMILTGYLGSCYAQEFPLAISASIALEQSYGHIDGDSASLAELCCLISALTLTPIKQSFAVTGSINQYGEVQTIGGVNEKIEGFFKLCKGRGLTGEQGCIIPQANIRNLMLKQEIIDAVANNEFAIYAVANVNEALELLTGESVGKKDNNGEYPEDSLNFKAISRLKEISDLGHDKDEDNNEDEAES
ncbi:ATP-dependent protease [Methylococcaceae bacterium CS5]|nr:AAA family ATPase [Methyloprofundus sp.]TXK95220.1 ATP-dependent protease [Methylococcaceae bacterium CS4]TXK97360.1 ATP-dependent protease [Methylococcaceae bacterium CS5]TXL09578.1 ATP-dependent protease [Methylococcaceae bacterium CS3]TXL12101.1 ATP-dependent protease [Methylococcaceae bacterium CS2]